MKKFLADRLSSARCWRCSALLALAALIWWVGPLIAIGERRPLDGVWARVDRDRRRSCCCSRCVVGVARAGAASAPDAALVDGTGRAGPSASDREAEVLGQRFAEALDVLEESASTSRQALAASSAAQYLYELPWYMFIGAPGSGKTTALINSGLDLPAGRARWASAAIARRRRHAQLRLVVHRRGGADRHRRPLHARRTATSEVDAAAWESFLGLLKQVAAAPADQRRAAHRQHPGPAAADAGRAQGARRQAARAPAGAARAARHASAGLRAGHQVRPARRLHRVLRRRSARRSATRSGASRFPLRRRAAADDPPVQDFGSEFAALETAPARPPARPAARPSATSRSAPRSSPSRSSSPACSGLLGGFLEQVFDAGGTLEQRPLLRGVYFTSGTQEGTPIDRVHRHARAHLRPRGARLPPIAAASGKSFFLTRLLQGRGVRRAGPGRREPAGRDAAAGACALAGMAAIGAAAALALLAGWAVSYMRNKAYLAEVAGARCPSVKTAVDALPPADNRRRVAPLPQVLDTVRRRAEAGRLRRRRAAAARTTLGPVPGRLARRRRRASATSACSTTRCCRAWPSASRSGCAPSTSDNLELAYEALKSYLMLYTPEHFDAESLQGLGHARLGREPRRARCTRAARRRSTQHLDAVLAQGAPRAARADGREPGRQRARHAGRLPARVPHLQPPASARSVGADYPAVHGGGAPAGPNSAQRVRARQRRAAHQGHPGPVHPATATPRRSRRSVDKVARQLAAEETLGARPAADGRRPPLRDGMRRRRADRTGCAASTSRSTSRSGTSTSPTCAWSSSAASRSSLQVARMLSGVDSPLAAFLRAVARETHAGAAAAAAAERQRQPRSASSTQKAAAGQGARWPRCSARRPRRAEPRAAGGPLEEMVDDHFAPIRRLVAGAAAADRRDPEAVQRGLRAARRGRCGAEEQVAPPPPRRRRRRVKAAAGQQPEPITLDAREARRRRRAARAAPPSAQGLTGELKPISDFCTARSPAAIPFAAQLEGRRAARRLRPAVRRRRPARRLLPAPAGRLVDTGTKPWTFKPLADGTKPANGAALADFQRARAHQGGLLPRRRQDAGVQGRPARVEMDRRPEGADPRHRRPGLQVRRRQHRGADRHLAEPARRLADQALDRRRPRRRSSTGRGRCSACSTSFEVQPSPQPETLRRRS